MTALEVCKGIRAIDSEVPVLFLTARTEEIDRVRGFGLGADDYVAKPFSSKELVGRIHAIQRRMMKRRQEPDDGITMHDLTIKPTALRAFRGPEVIKLTAREVNLLKLLHERAGFVVSKDELYDRCWGRTHFANSRALDQFIASLRRKIENPATSRRIIATVHGSGYRFDP